MDHDGRIHRGRGVRSKQGGGVKSTAILQPIAVSMRPHTDGAGGWELFSLEFQQVAVDLVIYIGVVFLLAEV